MKIYFDNQSSQYPIVLLPELALDILSMDLSDDEIASDLGLTPPAMETVDYPKSPNKRRYIERHKRKTEIMEIPVGCVLPVFLVGSIIAGVSMSDSNDGPFFLVVIFFLSSALPFFIFGALNGSLTSYVETKGEWVELSNVEYEKLSKEYENNLKEYYNKKKRIELKYNYELTDFKKRLSENSDNIKSKLISKSLNPFIQATRGNVSPKRGFAELRFLEKLDAELKGQIFIDMVPKASWSSVQDTYNPDFTFICNETNLHIDIEIDEPYTLKDKTAIHYIDGPDEERNEFFLDNNWCVIRFTEKQVIQQTEECINTIKSIHESLLNQKEYYYSELIPEPRWTYEEAFIMQGKGYREGYLR